MRQGFLAAWHNLIEKRFMPLRGMTALAPVNKGRRKTCKLDPVPNLSRASKCVWQMDREA